MSGLWISPDDLPDDLASSEFAVEACEAASFLLWGMSGRKFSGLTTVTELYGKNMPEVSLRMSELSLSSTDLGSTYSALPEYRADLHNKIRLRGKPVKAIISVFDSLSGGEISDTHYKLFDHATLVFDFYLINEIEVTYSYGTPPPAAGKMAARQLATQFAYLWDGQMSKCTLPDRVMNVQRQNVSWVLLDQQDFIADLRTGVYAVDLFLKTVNPDRATQRAKVFSPDIKRGRRPTPLG